MTGAHYRQAIGIVCGFTTLGLVVGDLATAYPWIALVIGGLAVWGLK